MLLKTFLRLYVREAYGVVRQSGKGDESQNMMRSVAALLVAVQLGLLLSVTSGAVPHFVCPANRAERTPFPEDLVFERDNCRVEAPKISTTNLDTATRGIIYQVHTDSISLDRAVQVARRNIKASGGPINVMLYTWRELWEAYNPDGAVSFEGSEYRGLPVPHPSHPFSHIKFFDDMEVPLLGKVVAAEARAVSRDRGMQKVGVMTAMYQAAIFLESPFDLNLFAATDSCLCGDYLPFMFGLLDDTTQILTSMDPGLNQGGQTILQVPSTYRERNLGWLLWKRDSKVAGMFVHYARTLAESFVRHYQKKLTVRNGRPAFRETLYIWRNAIKEKLLSHETKVCRGWMHYGKFMDTCSNHDLSVGQGEMGAACMAGCMVAHERCECWVDRPITGRNETAAETETRRLAVQQFSVAQERNAAARDRMPRRSRQVAVPGETAPMTGEEFAFWQAIQRPSRSVIQARATVGQAAEGGDRKSVV